MLRLPLIDPVALYLGPLQVPWVALLYLGGFVLAGRFGRCWINGRPAADLTVESWEGVLAWSAIGAVVLARIASRWEGLGTGTPGLAFPAGLGGAFLASAAFAWSRKRPWWPLADLLALVAPIFLAAHSFGELIGQAGWGLPTGLPWGVVFPEVDDLPRHPVALYALALQGGVLLFVLRTYARRGRPPGAAFALFMAGFGASASLLAFLRGPAPFEALQWIGLAVMVAGLLLLIRRTDNGVEIRHGKSAGAVETGQGEMTGMAAAAAAKGLTASSARRFHVSLSSVLAVGAVAGLVAWSHQSRPAPRMVATLAQASFPDLGGVPQPLSQWRGKTVVLNFWATWCPPCRQEVPILEAAQRRYAAQGLTVVGVALDDADAVRAFARQYRINYPVLVSGDAGNSLAKQLGNRLGVVPYTVVLDGQGRITATQTGAINAVRLETLVAPLLKRSQTADR
jgi:prolipoprotein diacylglyceryltransferase/thiol-disulfide isomerase/thioredoxin